MTQRRTATRWRLKMKCGLIHLSVLCGMGYAIPVPTRAVGEQVLAASVIVPLSLFLVLQRLLLAGGVLSQVLLACF